MIPPLPAPEVTKSLELQETNNTILERVERSVSGLTKAILEKEKRDDFKDQEDKREDKPRGRSETSSPRGIDIDFSEAGLIGLATKLLNKTAASVLMAGVLSQTGMDTAARIPFMLDKITDGVKGLYSGVKAILPSVEGLTKLSQTFPRIASAIEGITSKTRGFFSIFFKMFTVLGKLPGVSSIMRVVQPFMSVAGNLGKVLFGPITLVIFSMIDFVKGAIEGYDKEGVFGAVKGGIIGVFNGLISKPLDLIKDIASWSAEKLGFENFSNILDSFSFEKIATGVFENIFGIVSSVGDYIKNLSDTYSKEGAWGIIKTGVIGLVSSIISKPFDLMKSATSLILDKFNMSEYSDLLNSFSFSDIANKLLTSIFNNVGSWVDTTIQSGKAIAGKAFDLWTLIENMKGVMVTKLSEMAGGFIDNAREFSMAAINFPFENFLIGIKDSIVNKTSEMLSNALDMSKNAVYALPTMFTNIGGWIVDNLFMPAMNTFTDMLPDIDDIKQMFSDFSPMKIFEQISNSIKGIVKSMILSALPDEDSTFGKLFSPIRKLLGPETTDIASANDNNPNAQQRLTGQVSERLVLGKSSLFAPQSMGAVNVFADNSQKINNVTNATGGSSGGSGGVTTRATPPSWR